MRFSPTPLAAVCPLLALTFTLASAQPAPATPPLQLERFVVTPSHFDFSTGGPGRATLTQQDLETLPQIGEDLFRSIARLPGVAADDYTARFWVRGAPNRQMLVRVDGADLLEPFHLKDVDGALAAIDLHAISRLDLMTGGFNADYGNAAAAVLTMETLTANGPQPHTALGLSLTSMRAGTTGTLAQGAGRWLGSIRRGYPDLALKVAGRDNEIFPRYWDAYAKFEYDLSPAHTLSFHALHTGDTLRVSKSGDPELRSGYDTDYLWGRWRAQFGDRVNAETVLTQGWLSWRRNGDGTYGNGERLNLRDRRSLAITTLRQDWSFAASDRALVRAGWQYETASAEYSYHLLRQERTVSNGVITVNTRTVDLAPRPDGDGFGAFVAPRFAVLPNLTVEPGLRFDRHNAPGDEDVSPRLNAALALSPTTTLRAGWGRYAQSQGLHELAVPFGDATFYRSELAEHRVVSLEHRLPNAISLRAEAYQRLTDRPRPHWINRYDSYNIFPEAQTDRFLLTPSSAEARGVELLVQRRGRGRIDWTLSYALSKADENVGGTTIPSLRDQRHAFYADVSYSPNPRWRFSAAWQYHTGWPITDLNYTLVTLNNGGRSAVRSFGPVLGSRLPAYHRLDLRASRIIETRHGVVKVFLDIFNAYDHRNLLAYDYDPSVTVGVLTVRKTGRDLLPILPTAGISWEL
jgi:outer membrane cobalamin receptor